MVWQEVIRHVSDRRVIVESKSGNQYPVGTEYDRIGRDVYQTLGNIHATQHKTDYKRELWGWVEFTDDDGPILEYLSSGSPTGGPPEKPPWEL